MAKRNIKKNILFILVLPTLLITTAALKVKNRSLIYTNQQQTTNNVIFEKMEYEIYNKSLFVENWVDVRPVAWNVVKANASANLTQPINELWIHFILFRKYNTYKKFLIDVKFEGCGFLNGTVNDPVGQYIMENYLRMQDNVQMNFKLQCPISGMLTASTQHLNVSEFIFPLMPAGRYRIDAYAMAKRNGPNYGVLRWYYQISDLRVWFWFEYRWSRRYTRFKYRSSRVLRNIFVFRTENMSFILNFQKKLSPNFNSIQLTDLPGSFPKTYHNPILFATFASTFRNPLPFSDLPHSFHQVSLHFKHIKWIESAASPFFSFY